MIVSPTSLRRAVAGIALLAAILLPHAAHATTWYAVVDDAFNRSNTSTGSAGSTSGVGNSWIDVAGSVWNIGSNQLQGYSAVSSDYLTKFLIRPSSEDSQNQREVVTIPANENFGQFLGVVLRYQSDSKNHYLAHISASGIYLYKIIGGTTTLVGSNLMSISNAKSYTIDFAATSTNPTNLSVVVTNVTDGVLTGSLNATDSASSLQTSGSAGLSTWYNSGTNTTHVSRVQTYNSTIPTVLNLIGSSSFTGSTGVAMPITDLQVSGPAASTTPVKLLVTSGSLAMSTVTGLTFTGGQTGSVLYFSGTVADINAALSTLTYTRSGTGTDTLEASLVQQGEVFFSDNSHLYKFITSTLSWNSAKTAAEAQTAYGVSGYLATIGSSAENNFVAARLTGDGWIGASDSTSEGDWKWVTGPEAGTSFWSGAGSGSGGHTVNSQYANWNGTGEPNDSGGNEDCAELYISGNNWNDLPCSGTTLSGYLVEFGAPGNLPTVTAKNVAITTGSAPTVTGLSPADNASSVTANANLVVTFSASVSTSTGTITIKKSSDDSTFESVDVTGPKLTGGGTNTITINPTGTFAEGTGYYVTIPGTAFKDGSNNFYTGISATSTWNFTTGDFTAPTISATSTSVGSTTATVTWTTNEAASSKVSYGPIASYSTSTAESDTGTRVTSHSVSLSGLASCATYHYAVVSRDASSNAATSSDATFLTSGCSGDASQISATSTMVTASAGGTSSLTEQNSTISVTAPSNFTATSSSVVIQIHSLSGDVTLASLGKPSSAWQAVGDIVFDVKAIINSTTILDSFDSPVTISYQYSDSDISGLNESGLWLYHYHGGSWSALDSCSVSQSTNTITCTAPSFSIFSLFGQAAQSTSSSGGSSSGSTLENRIKNLNDMGLVVQAEALKKEWAGITQGSTTKPIISGRSMKCMVPATDKALRFGSEGEDVRSLQAFLNCAGFSLAEKGPGSPGNETIYFSAKTHAALIRFQERYAPEILAPVGAARGTGIFGSFSKKKALGL